jgi:catechol 2,3-dioxygenase-like lactoylglutathione lyase family enzyme
VPSRIAAIAIDAVEPTALADFWCQVLGWRIVEEDVGQAYDASWVVLSDPEGNEFCLLSRSAQEV